MDFSYFEYPNMDSFEETVVALLAFARSYKAKTGFTPGAFIVYFVNRTGRKYQWPQLNYGGEEGLLCIAVFCSSATLPAHAQPDASMHA